MNKLFFIFSTLIGMMFIIQGCRDDDTFQEVQSTIIEADLVFLNQSDFDAFEEMGYTTVIGDVSIRENVTSLVPLRTLTNIEGNLSIKNTQLVTLEGLENLVSITGSLSITSDFQQNIPIQNIEDFCALQNLFINGMFDTVTIMDNGFNPTVQDIINGDCIMMIPTFDCPSFELNFGDACEDVDGNPGVITEECECEILAIFDCPDLEANIGDACEDAEGNPGFISQGCVCLDANSFDCPEIGANIGDPCTDVDGNPGSITEDCACL